MNLLLWIGRMAGIAGVIVAVVAAAARMQGRFVIGPYQVGTLMIVGIALMVAGCLAYVASIAEQRQPAGRSPRATS